MRAASFWTTIAVLMAGVLSDASTTRTAAGVADSRPRAEAQLSSCRTAVTHGQAQIEIAQTKRLVEPAKGSPHYCRSEIRVRGPVYEERRVYRDIEPVGAPYGAALLREPIGRFRGIAKLGDYDGRLLLVDEQGRVIDLPGPEYLIGYGRFLVVRHHTDARLSIAVFLLEEGRVGFSALDDQLARLFGDDIEAVHLKGAQWLDIGGQLYVWLPESPAGSHGSALRLDRRRGVLARAALSAEQAASAQKLSFRGLEGWRDCACDETSSGTR